MIDQLAASEASVSFKQGQRVLILCDDESADERFHGRLGVVTGFMPEPGAEPLVVVTVEGLGAELFFPRELIAEPSRPAKRMRATSESSWGDSPA